jgi:hypothetical protein
LTKLPPDSRRPFLCGAFRSVANEFKIDVSMVSRWFKKSLHFDQTPQKTRKNTRLATGEKSQYKEQEEMLFDAVFIRRQLLGLWVDRYWLQDEFNEILKLTKPEGWSDFKCSSGWVSNFCRRWCITKQARTNKKDVPIAVKEPLIKDFHRQMLKLQRSVHSDLLYGRFSPLRMFHADQSPCEFAMPGTWSLNIQGTPAGCGNQVQVWTSDSLLFTFAFEQKASR